MQSFSPRRNEVCSSSVFNHPCPFSCCKDHDKAKTCFVGAQDVEMTSTDIYIFRICSDPARCIGRCEEVVILVHLLLQYQPGSADGFFTTASSKNQRTPNKAGSGSLRQKGNL